MKAHAIEIAGIRYWDGGYSANPPLLPLVEAADASELLVVQIMPTQGQAQPRTAPDIVRRLEQVTFNGVLQRDMATLATMMELSAIAETAWVSASGICGFTTCPRRTTTHP